MTRAKKAEGNFTGRVDLKLVDKICLGKDPGQLISLLGEIQEAYGYLPEKALRRVCRVTGIAPADVIGVVSFYSQFRLKPAGRHTIKVCLGTACHVNGAESVYNAFHRYLGMGEGEDTDGQKLFSLQRVGCLGCCMLAPAVQIDDITYGFLAPDKVPAILKDFLSSQGSGGEQEKNKAAVSSEQAAGIRMCTCTSCQAAGAGKVFSAFKQEISDRRLPVILSSVACTGISYAAPLVEVLAGSNHRVRYGRVTPQVAHLILARHFTPRNFLSRIKTSISGLAEKLLVDSGPDDPLRYLIDSDNPPFSLFWERQKHLITEHCGEIDPLDLAAYKSRNGFAALARCLDGFDSAKIIEEIEESRLCGRGGAGFSTALKWRTALQAGPPPRYLVCNGDEGDPGAFMDRMILESFPFRVIEGMAIAAYALQAKEAFVYIRREYPLALKRVKTALELCRQNGLLGENIMGLGFSLEIKVVEGAGAFVCGEETALIAAIQGKRGTPRYKPPYPAQEGLWERPTVVNNVETLASIPWILLHGGRAFAAIGTAASKGTKTFALAGKIKRGGLIEVPMGTTLREIIYEIGGGMQKEARLKAVQIGGPSGGCLPAQYIDTAVDFTALQAAGAIMGSGGLIVLDENDCMVDVARYFMQFIQAESCGKCTCCRIGTRRMLEILERICQARGQKSDLDELASLARVIQRGSLCGLGQTAPNPVLSTLRYFKEEYELHINGSCPAKKCKALIHYTISDDCLGCTRCAQNCPADAISSVPHRKHSIDDQACIRCDTCRTVCPAKAVRVE